MEHLKKSLTPLLLWSIAVGNVISGMYFGWNLGLEKGGTYGMAIATAIVIILYICFSYSYAELACAIPKAGGGFDYASRAYGANVGFITGLSQILIYLFTPPAIAIGIGTNLNLAFPTISIQFYAIIIYFIFTAINILGVKLAATIELTITIIAVLGLLLFASITIPHVSLTSLQKNASIGGFEGILAAIPFAIWFFLGIEGLANVAEESENPQKDLSNGFSRAIITLIFLCFITFICSVGFNGWQSVVYDQQNMPSDSPLTLVIDGIYGKGHLFYTILIYISILGLVASFHGCIMSGGRATFEFARFGYLPSILGKIHSRYKTPASALIFNTLIGILTILTGKTGEIITFSVFGAITLYAISMASLLKLRVSEPLLFRPYKVFLFPYLPIIAMVISILCFLAMAFYYTKILIIFAVFIGIGFALFKLIYKNNQIIQ